MMNKIAKQYLIDAAEKRCRCTNCMKEKALKEDRALRASKPSLELPSKIFKNPFGFTTDLLTKTFSVDPFWDHTP